MSMIFEIQMIRLRGSGKWNDNWVTK